jgi:hypothetical protein
MQELKFTIKLGLTKTSYIFYEINTSHSQRKFQTSH